MKNLKGWRTYIVSGVAILAIAANAALGVLDVDPQAEWATVLSAVVMAVLRSVTSTPPGKVD